MFDPWDILKLLSDPTRIRLLNLLEHEELSVAELQEILSMGQSRISTHLGLLRQADLVIDRRSGKKSFYSLNKKVGHKVQELLENTRHLVAKDPQIDEDIGNLNRVMNKRRKAAEDYFNLVAGRLGKNYCPGRSWEAIGHLLLQLIPHVKIADLGAGEGMLSQLLAKRAKHVYCIDSSQQMVKFGSEVAKKNAIDNMTYMVGDIEKVPLKDCSVDIAFLSQALHHAQHPERAIAEAHRILKPKGQIIVIDLKEHTFERARDLYADLWLGFPQSQIYHWLKEVGFSQVEVNVVAKEEHEPHFQTLLAHGIKDT